MTRIEDVGVRERERKKNKDGRRGNSYDKEGSYYYIVALQFVTCDKKCGPTQTNQGKGGKKKQNLSFVMFNHQHSESLSLVLSSISAVPRSHAYLTHEKKKFQEQRFD